MKIDTVQLTFSDFSDLYLNHRKLTFSKILKTLIIFFPRINLILKMIQADCNEHIGITEVAVRELTPRRNYCRNYCLHDARARLD